MIFLRKPISVPSLVECFVCQPRGNFPSLFLIKINTFYGGIINRGLMTVICNWGIETFQGIFLFYF